MKIADLQTFKLPDAPGVYFFLGKRRKILYIGKATSLKDRVKSYFVRDILMTRSPLIAKMLGEAKKIEFIKTGSVLEALLLEANEIKKHQPLYNSKEKDDKSYNYVTITREPFPKVIVTRGSGTFGPFPYGGELKQALKIIRKIFPFRDKCKLGQKKLCFNAQIGLCPGVCTGQISQKAYRETIKHLKLFFEGKKKILARTLKRDMKELAKSHRFEEAEKVKRRIFALEHIQDIALIKNNARSSKRGESFRIEAYDIAHISGKEAVGAMTVVSDGVLNKGQYRKFKIHVDKNNDTANLREVLTRRFAHLEWLFPNLVVVDGGKGQINVARSVMKKLRLTIEVVSVLKNDKHQAKEILNFKSRTLQAIKDSTLEKSILLANSEAHRFAISYHRQLRGKGFKI